MVDVGPLLLYKFSRVCCLYVKIVAVFEMPAAIVIIANATIKLNCSTVIFILKISLITILKFVGLFIILDKTIRLLGLCQRKRVCVVVQLSWPSFWQRTSRPVCAAVVCANGNIFGLYCRCRGRLLDSVHQYVELVDVIINSYMYLSIQKLKY